MLTKIYAPKTIKISKNTKKIVVYEKRDFSVPSIFFKIISEIGFLRWLLFSREIVFHRPTKAQIQFVLKNMKEKYLVLTIYENRRKAV